MQRPIRMPTNRSRCRCRRGLRAIASQSQNFRRLIQIRSGIHPACHRRQLKNQTSLNPMSLIRARNRCRPEREIEKDLAEVSTAVGLRLDTVKPLGHTPLNAFKYD
jgi:hypothetical protein